ncbi:HypC/HybG/HupF family hydrogenase formation chaperone [Streptomyces sp. TRM70308]|uniref:HypC/HybG/HupF family hydrogenase formation chaperone n=1 Tax=Streptomyces TaxID=1883 RepID=UPI0022490824|nr:HypC/HybG/HupF family hydrogenase formation chaperone [Streptomyces sp. JHD 1]MCX2969200.1 HypC/HybG/HupF family hydrogenase formation chaperone [Streptomyces sp. JHD 1]
MCLAVPGRVVGTSERDGTPMAQVDFGGVVKDVCLAYVPDARAGEYVVVHVGFALQRLDEESARASLALFEQLGLLDEEFGDAWGRAAAEAGAANPAAGGAVPEADGALPGAAARTTTAGADGAPAATEEGVR